MKTKTLAAEKASVDSKAVWKASAVALLSFLFGAAKLFGAISPFSAAFVCGLPIKYTLTAAVGGIVGSLLFAPNGRAGYYVTAILLIFGVRILLAKFYHHKLKPIFYCLAAFTVCAFCAVFYALIAQLGATAFVLLCIEVLLTACFAYFFSLCSGAVLRKKSGVLSYTEQASLCMLGVAAIMSLAGFFIFRVNLGVIAGVIVIFIVMNRFGLIGASVSAILVSIALTLSSTSMLEFCGMLIIASFLAGVFSPLGKFGQIAAFISVSTFSLLLLGAPTMLIYRLVDIFFAAAVFVLIPERFLNLVKPADNSGPALTNPTFMQSGVSHKLSFASDTIRDLQNELEGIAAKFNEIDYHNIGTIYEAAAGTVCKGCTKMLSCWDEKYADTLDAFNPISDTLRTCGEVTKETLPSYFREKCCKADKLCAAVNEYYRGFVSQQNTKRRISEARRIVFEQMDSVSDMLLEVSEEIGEVAGYDERMMRAVSAAFEKIEGEPEQIVCAVDHCGRSFVEIYTSEAVKTSPTVLCETLSSAAKCDFDLPSICQTKGKTKISFFEKASYTLDFSVQQSCVGDNSICGDSFEQFTDTKGYAYLLLSDGMGSGKRAAVDSVMTCSVLSKLLKAGFGLDSAVKMINSSLLVKSTDESLATIDLARVDLYSGKADFYKAGAATSFIYAKGEVRRMKSEGLPVGILQGISPEKQSATLREGDVVLMISDGATSAGEGWLSDELRQNAHKSAKEIAVRICYEAKQRCRELHPDDITVLAFKVEKGV